MFPATTLDWSFEEGQFVHVLPSGRLLILEPRSDAVYVFITREDDDDPLQIDTRATLEGAKALADDLAFAFMRHLE